MYGVSATLIIFQSAIVCFMPSLNAETAPSKSLDCTSICVTVCFYAPVFSLRVMNATLTR